MADSDFTCIADLAREVEIPRNGILTRTLHQDDQLKVVVFGFDAGQELSEHTAAELALGTDSRQARPGTWVHMPAQLPHSVRAKTPVLMLLLLLKAGGSPDGSVGR
jgi:quercetin dioxygenase-like cupin family protein